MEPGELDQILIEEGFDKDEPRDVVEPLRRVGAGKMAQPEEENNGKKEEKPSLFQRFVGFVKGKSKPKKEPESKPKESKPKDKNSKPKS